MYHYYTGDFCHSGQTWEQLWTSGCRAAMKEPRLVHSGNCHLGARVESAHCGARVESDTLGHSDKCTLGPEHFGTRVHLCIGARVDLCIGARVKTAQWGQSGSVRWGQSGSNVRYGFYSSPINIKFHSDPSVQVPLWPAQCANSTLAPICRFHSQHTLIQSCPTPTHPEWQKSPVYIYCLQGSNVKIFIAAKKLNYCQFSRSKN